MLFHVKTFLNWGIHLKGSGDVVSAVCYTMYTIYICLCSQTAETTSPEHFSRISLYVQGVPYNLTILYVQYKDVKNGILKPCMTLS